MIYGKPCVFVEHCSSYSHLYCEDFGNTRQGERRERDDRPAGTGLPSGIAACTLPPVGAQVQGLLDAGWSAITTLELDVCVVL